MTPLQFHTNQTPTLKSKAHENGKPEEMHMYDCPFCGKDQHLYYFPANTAWDCKACGRSGNVYSFIQLLYSEVCNEEIQPLVKAWELPTRVFQNIKYNPLNDTYVIPTFRNNRLNNLYKYVENLNKIMGTPGIGATLLDWTDDAYKEIWLCEGQKDKLAGEAIIGSREITAVGMPGANMFKESWCMAFQGKKLIIVMDNDEPGEKGKKRIIDIIKRSSHRPAELYEVRWPDHTIPGYDLRDFYQENQGRSWHDLQHLIHPIQEQDAIKVVTETIIGDFSCNTFDKSLESFKTAYYTTPDMYAVLSMCLASIFSIKVPGEQLWLRPVGAPGVGKTAIAKALSASEYVVSKSKFTGLFSGWKDQSDDDAGLIPEIEGRTLIVKDADSLLKQSNIEEIMGDLRDFYDKESSVTYRNRKSYNYSNIKATFIMMGTQVLRRVDHSFLGERFVTMEMDVTEKERMLISQKQMDKSLAVALGKIDDPEIAIKEKMKGWIEHLRERELESSIPQEFQQEIIRLSNLTALLRTQVDRNFRGRLQSPAVPELPTRLIGQMTTATLSLSVVFGLDHPNQDVYSIVKKCLKDTINPRSHRYVICDTILENPNIGAADILEATGLDKSTVNEELNDLLELQFVSMSDVSIPNRPGVKIKGFKLKDKISTPLTEIVRQ
jgi:ribosomal protein L37AE/L43A